MFEIGNTVMYGIQGLCKIDCIETKTVGKVSADYYVLKPMGRENTSLFVPLENSVLTSRMRDLLTVEQANELMKNAAQIKPLTYKDENSRREDFKSILHQNNREQLAAVIKTIYIEKEARRAAGKKLNIFDEQTLRQAELLLYNELAFVLSISTEELLETFDLTK